MCLCSYVCIHACMHTRVHMCCVGVKGIEIIDKGVLLFSLFSCKIFTGVFFKKHNNQPGGKNWEASVKYFIKAELEVTNHSKPLVVLKFMCVHECVYVNVYVF